MPIQARLFNGQLLEFPDDTPMEVVNRVAQEQTKLLKGPEEQPVAVPPPPPQTQRTVGQSLADLGAGAIAGTGSILAFPGQIASLVPGLRGVGSAIATPGEAIREFGEGLKSEGLKVREALRSQAISEAEKEGVLASFATAITSTLKDPALISTFLAEQVPMLLPPLAAARLYQILGRGAIAAAERGLVGEAAQAAAQQAAQQVNRRAYAAAVGTGAAMQGADISSDTYKRAYEAAIAQGQAPDEAETNALNAARLAFTGATGVSLLTQRLPGARAIEERFARLPGSTGRIKAGLGEATQEGLEEAGGALFQNLGVRTVDPNAPLLEGVGAAAGLGVIGGGVFGSLLGKRGTQALAPGQREGESLEQTVTRLSTERANLLGQLQPTTEQFPSEIKLIEMINRDPERAYSTIVKHIQSLEQLPESEARTAALQTAEGLRQRLSVEDIQRQIPSRREVITAQELRQLGFAPQDPIVQQLSNKDLAKPEDAVSVLDTIKTELQQENISPKRYEQLVGMREAVDALLAQIPGSAFYAGEVEQPGVGERTPVVEPADRQSAEAAGTTERGGVAAPSEFLPKPAVATAESSAPIEFETAKGSVYKVDDEGRTSRTKRSPGEGQGQTYDYSDVLYVTPEHADAILDESRVPFGVSVRLGYRDGNVFRSVATRAEIPAGVQPYVAVVNRDSNTLIRAFPAQMDPVVGMSPVEKMYNKDGTATTHIGNPIVKMRRVITKDTLKALGIKPISAQGKRLLGKDFNEVKKSLKPEELEAKFRELETKAKQPAKPTQPKEPAPPTAEEVAIKDRIAEIDKQLAGLLKKVLQKYGLNNVGVELAKDLEANGEYANRLIRLADNHENPILHLRHESIHALKDLGFFTPQQWSTLEDKARTEWVNTFLKNVQHNETQSRYDAYMEMFKADGKTDAEAEQAIVEEAIADAFSYFQKAKPPAGLIASINNRLKNFFKAIKEFLRVNDLTAEDIFGKIEAGQLEPAVGAARPNSWKADTEEKEKAEAYEEENGIKPYVSEGQLTVPIEGEAKKLSIKSPYRGRALTGYIKKRRDGTTEVVPPKFNDPLTGLPLNKDGTVTVYLPTTNEMAREIIRTKRIKAASPTANRIYLTNESSGKAILGNLGNIDSPVDGANVMLKLDPQLLHIDQEFSNGRKDFFLPIAEGEAFAQKAAMTKLFTMNLPRDKAISKDTKLTDLERRIQQAIQEYVTLSGPQQKVRLEEAKDILKSAHNVGSLLSVNGKLEKTNTGGYGLNNYNGKDVMSMGLGMASAQRINEQKLSTCPNSAMCEGLCLGETSGQNELYGGEGQFRSGPRLAQYLKTEALVLHPEEFSVLLYDEIQRFQKTAVEEDYQPSVRLNVTSDFRPQVFKAIIDAFPGVQFYDYTKLPSNTIAPNHHLTYSSTGASQVVNGEVIVNPGSNWKKMVERMLQGQNVAMAFTSKTTMPDFVVDEATDERFQVWDGDNYDARFLDPKPGQPENLFNRGMIIGLTNKDRTTPPNQAAKKYKGFFMHYERSRDGDTLVVPDQDALKESKSIEIKLKRSLRSQTEKRGKWYTDSTPQQQTTLDKWEDDRVSGSVTNWENLNIRAAREDIYDSASANFYDYEKAPGLFDIPISDIGPLTGYNSEKDQARIRNLANQIKENGEIEPVFVAVDPDGESYLMEGQHRSRALELLGYKSVPARVIVSMDQEDQPSPKFSLRSPLGFYSALMDGIQSSPTTTAPAGGWKAQIKGMINKGQVKQDEIEWSNINDYLDLQTGKVSKDDLLNYLKTGGVQVEEVLLSRKIKDEKTWYVFSDSGLRVAGYPTEEQANARAAQESEKYDAEYRVIPEYQEVSYGDESKYGKFTIPGGTNYREVLLTLPEDFASDDFIDEMEKKYGANAIYDVYDNVRVLKTTFPSMLSPEDQRRFQALEQRPAPTPYSSPHWDQPNVIAHIRLNDRIDADGNKVLFVEEIQSDWGQEGKKKEFKLTEAEIEEKRNRLFDAGDIRGASTVPMSEVGKLPKAPFVTKTEGWLNLALKRAIVMAAEGGYDKVAFINGEQSADRYDLSKQVSQIIWSPTDNTLVATPVSGGQRITRENVKEEDLPGIIGKEAAQKLLESEKVVTTGYYRLRGDDLRVGGEGMKAFYNTIVPTAVKKLLPKVGGGQMGQINIPGAPENIEEGGSTLDKQPAFDVTPEMREKVKKGLPLFSLRSELPTRRSVLDRIPELEQAAQGIKEGTVTRDQYEKLVNALKPVTPYAEVPNPASVSDMRRALKLDQLPRIGIPARELEAGDPVGLRLDIPAYANHGVWVVSVHEQQPGFAAGKSIGYESVAAVTNPQFGVVETGALNIAGGKPKSTIAVMKGDWKPLTKNQAIKTAEMAMKSNNWVQVGMDPTRHSYFYDRTNMEPVVSADEAVQIGPLVLAKNPVYGEKSDFKFSLRAQTQTPAFKRWFGDSKVVDENGEPLVVYHGTGADISVFDMSKQDLRDAGFWFANNAAHAGSYAAGRRNENIMPLYLSIKNPKVYYNRDVKITPELIKSLEKEGYDGVVRDFAGGPDAWRYAPNQREYAAFYPEQIKSAIGNIGTFDPTNPDIRKSLRSTLPPTLWNRVDNTIGQRHQKTWVKRITDAISPTNWSDFRTNALNRYEGLARIDRMKVQKMGGARLLADQSAEAAALMSDLGSGISAAAFGVHDRIGGYPIFKNGVVTIENQNGTVKGPLAIFAPLAAYGDPEIFRVYQFWVTAQRGQRLNAEGRLTPFDAADMAEVKRINNDPRLGPLFKQVKDDWIKYNDGLVKFLETTGVITPEASKEFRIHGDYFPMYKYMEQDDVAGPRVFSSIANVPVPKKLKGDEVNPMGDFFENVVRNTQSAIQMGIKNIAAQQATKVAMDVGVVRPLGHRPAKMQPEYYRVLENGKEVFYVADDVLFMNAMRSLNLPDLPFIGFLAAPANLLRNLVTKTPDFMMANMLRDSVAAWVTSGTDITPVISTLKNFGAAIAEKSPELNALRNSGVLGGYDYAQGVEVTAKRFAKDLRKISKTRTEAEKLASPFTSIWEALEKGSAASDAATRMEVYKKTLDETGNEAEALFRALEVMNFNRKGRSPVIRILTASIPFLNARMQGLDVLYRAGIRPILTGDASTREKEIAKTFWVRGMTIMALSAMYWALTHDDDEYKKQEQETRDNYWLFPSMGIKIPIPFEIGVVFKVIPERIAEYAFGSDTGKDFVESMSRQLRSTFGVNYAPQAVLPLWEAQTNFSYFTQRPIIGQGMEEVSAPYQVAPTTSRTSQGLANAYNEIISFLPENVQKKIQASPIILDHLIQGYTGTMGTYAVQAIDAVINANSDIPSASKRFEQMPVIKRFALDPQARGTVSAYYDLKNSVTEVVRTSNLLERTGQFDEYAQYLQKNIGMLASQDYVNDLEKTMKDLREMKLVIRTSTMSGDAKREQLDNVERLEAMLTSNIQKVKKSL